MGVYCGVVEFICVFLGIFLNFEFLFKKIDLNLIEFLDIVIIEESIGLEGFVKLY